jgi:hypothetical protein
MKHERVVGHHVDLNQLHSDVVQHLQSQGLQVLADEAAPGYISIHARKGGVGRTLIGAVRDAEVMIAGTSENFEVTLRTGAWGRDIAIPAVEGFLLLGGIEAAGGAGLGVLMAHEFEAKFWKWLRERAEAVSGGQAQIGTPYAPPMVTAESLAQGTPLPSSK